MAKMIVDLLSEILAGRRGRAQRHELVRGLHLPLDVRLLHRSGLRARVRVLPGHDFFEHKTDSRLSVVSWRRCWLPWWCCGGILFRLVENVFVPIFSVLDLANVLYPPLTTFYLQIHGPSTLESRMSHAVLIGAIFEFQNFHASMAIIHNQSRIQCSPQYYCFLN